ncbi:iron-sulfur cluster repair di-iron protein, ric [Jeotgalibaca sp. MA1X17-3]|uniref:iron-sulfur cluster repair di-iron protein, ric n=1 Tax=Jeotgalibaca sp. MA1X17-3 TaxID=2908211 RepID=UPI001F3E676B|nr:iron-sulfur cluster repair di-iron protein, ric [Jeotgalibaca sp. MA1X17-3]UJF16009.1 iron-sulfur cluster repair di-iron protein, ric [Jeotgalibaca sp. MA1X17-3]
MMNKKPTFKEYMEKERDTLEMYTKAIAKVHGPHHPEIIEIRRIFETLEEKIATDSTDFATEFKNLRTLTNDYQAPQDTCETTVATYELLKEADRLYQTK